MTPYRFRRGSPVSNQEGVPGIESVLAPRYRIGRGMWLFTLLLLRRLVSVLRRRGAAFEETSEAFEETGECFEETECGFWGDALLLLRRRAASFEETSVTWNNRLRALRRRSEAFEETIWRVSICLFNHITLSRVFRLYACMHACIELPGKANA